jgi:hypothetical protein
VSTLKYANRAKSIANAVTRNEDSNEKLIRELQAQIDALKLKLIADGESNSNNNSGSYIILFLSFRFSYLILHP